MRPSVFSHHRYSASVGARLCLALVGCVVTNKWEGGSGWGVGVGEWVKHKGNFLFCVITPLPGIPTV